MQNQIARILIVDDNDLMRTLLRGMLRGEDYLVVGEAKNGVQAVEAVQRHDPDIVCLDVMMPDIQHRPRARHAQARLGADARPAHQGRKGSPRLPCRHGLVVGHTGSAMFGTPREPA